ncbi:16S rRNA pseudouridine(516) synthase RsuA [Nitrincola iocasae]|jgi:16S rRNA pseudouridine516 synthase|uniref:Pseudouridine synthase n=1 Tax=Nitrincola iocasae TaxID=2614693 RepID=A0A5J6LBC4_9GAMM|nr:16S rRNA pseudouridine(516) synthase RsuA [Nitrincola iocasae]QEW05512.1 16S rRNA pseudouridine(516) synthase RsuA [Nitrincola iocasae]
MRLDKYLAQATGMSRKEVKKQLHAGWVLVNDQLERDSGRHINSDDQVVLDGQLLSEPRPRFLMLHKPVGYICSNDDPVHATALTLIDLPAAEKLLIAGRLDLDTSGLLLLTDDGQWTHRITSPKHKLPKRYRTWLAEPLEANAEMLLQRGIMLKSEKQRTKPAQLERISDTEVLITLTEGRYHQVKRMFAALDNRVVALHREQIGEITLDDALAPGEYRDLTQAEIDSVYAGATPT